jgi:membrane-bound serine protease (ClpP class)
MQIRRLFAVSLLVAGATSLAAPVFAQEPEGPTIDVVEISGTIDLPIHRYVIERIDDAERRNVSLLVLHMDSLGALKVPQDEAGNLEIANRVENAAVPVAVHVGPRGAHAGGATVSLLENADAASMGPSSIYETEAGWITATQAQEQGLIQYVVPGVADLLLELHGEQASTPQGDVTLDIPKDLSTVRFWQAGPIRRMLHALAVPPLAYLLLAVGLMLLVFESSQPGFGVAGGTGVLLLAGAVYAFTVLPATILGMSLFLLGNALLTVDVIRDELKLPTWFGLLAFGAGSVLLLPAESGVTQLPMWVALATTFAAFLFFGPIMTLVHRSRRPIAAGVRRTLIGEPGDVRSMLNPEGYVMVGGELWRARLEQGKGRLRVGERIKVTGVDGAVLLVEGQDTSAN